MKLFKSLTILFSLITLTAAAQPAKKTITLEADGQPMLMFASSEHDFGTIAEGTQATYEFIYTNTGKAPLVLSSVTPPCSCTIPTWSAEPLLPGKSAKIMVTFDSKGKSGPFNKIVAVKHNGESGTDFIVIKGIVGT